MGLLGELEKYVSFWRDGGVCLCGEMEVCVFVERWRCVSFLRRENMCVLRELERYVSVWRDGAVCVFVGRWRCVSFLETWR